jgi:hypothetical protein
MIHVWVKHDHGLAVVMQVVHLHFRLVKNTGGHVE